MQRFFCDQLQALIPQGTDTPLPREHVLSDARVSLDADESHHALKVLRMKTGDRLELLDGHGRVAQGVIESAGKRLSVRVESIKVQGLVKPRLDVATAIPKGPRADVLIEQLSQLGVDRVIPLRTVRSVVDPRDSKLERFARAARESAKQCGRAHLMQVDSSREMTAVLAEPYDLRLLAHRGEANTMAMAEPLAKASSVLVLIGPEGGWTSDEVSQAVAAGCEAWQLGPHVMRIETAAVAAAAIVRAVTSTTAQP